MHYNTLYSSRKPSNQHKLCSLVYKKNIKETKLGGMGGGGGSRKIRGRSGVTLHACMNFSKNKDIILKKEI